MAAASIFTMRLISLEIKYLAFAYGSYPQD